MTRVTCREVQAAFAQDDADPAGDLDRHRERCAVCRSHERARAAIRESVLDANDVLDDVTRARVLARLLATRELRAAAGATSRGSRGARAHFRPLLGSLAIAAAIALTITGGMRWRNAGRGTASSPLRAAPVTLEPYLVHRTAGVDRSQRRDRLELPSQASMRARLGTRLGNRLEPLADLVLLGPLELVVRDAESARVELELRRGTLVGDFDGTGGRSLRIATADATVDIVGTRFLMEASSVRTRVSVEHGRVRVETRNGVRMLDAGQSWATDEGEPGASDARVAKIFAAAAREDLAGLDAEPPQTAAVTPPAARPQKLPGALAPPPAHERRRAERPLVALRAETEAATPPAHGPSRTTLPEPDTAAPDPAAPAPVAPVPDTVVPPPPVPPARATVTPALKPTALYQQAESAFSRGDDAKGTQLLNELVRAFPDQAMADSARFELALLAEKAGKPNEAMAETREILRAGAKGPFVEPARLLRCRIHLADDKENAKLCLERFVRDYPRSPHDDFALRTLTELAREAGRCAEAAKLADLYLQRHPQGSFAAEASRLRRGCAD